MKIVPLFKVTNIERALVHYTTILDFRLKHPDETGGDGVVNLINDDAELQLTVYESESLFGSVANVWVTDVDNLFEKYIKRGLDRSGKPDSPVHQGPTDQSWGNREFYVTDADGNTLRFCEGKRN